MAAQSPVLQHLTRPQRNILEAVGNLAATHPYAPTVREVQLLLGYGSVSTVHDHLSHLRAGGCVDWLDGQPRTLHVTAHGELFLS
jgi:repressor LexA